jgi:hypothetical protein
VFVLTATRAASANVAERCVGRRNGGPIRHQSTPHVVCVSSDHPVAKNVTTNSLAEPREIKRQSGWPISAWVRHFTLTIRRSFPVFAVKRAFGVRESGHCAMQAACPFAWFGAEHLPRFCGQALPAWRRRPL